MNDSNGMKVYEVVIRGFVLGEDDLPHPNEWGWDSLDKRVKLDFIGFPDIEISEEGLPVLESTRFDAGQWLEVIDGEAQEIYPIKGWDKKGNVLNYAPYGELKPVFDKILNKISMINPA